jgi:hypothetical protein
MCSIVGKSTKIRQKENTINIPDTETIEILYSRIFSEVSGFGIWRALSIHNGGHSDNVL